MGGSNGGGPGVEIWSDVSGAPPGDVDAIDAVFHAPVDYLLARPDQLRELRLPTHIRGACLVRDASELPDVPASADVVVVSSPALVEPARRSGRSVGLRSQIVDAESMEACRQAEAAVDVLLVRLRDDTNIPLELLLAEAQPDGTRVVKEVTAAEDALVTAGVLENGPSGVLFRTEDVAQIAELTRSLMHSEQGALPIVEAEVTAATHVGMGYRACVDTTSILTKDEGMVVGSTSEGGILVCAEVHHLPYMNLRPFRVNAGAVHSYVWAPDRTEYLTDLSAASRVLGVTTGGSARPLVVGRVKIEVRPLRLIEAVTGGGTQLNVFLQDDWHVRVFGADGAPLNLTEIRAGDRVLAHECEPGRHTGIKIRETIEER